MIPVLPDHLYKEMRCELDRIKNLQLPEENELEKSFGICMHYEKRLTYWVSRYHFENEAEEVFFFKITKPKFGSLIEYYKKLYQSILFGPVEIRARARYFEYEIDKTDKFFIDNAAFYQYYKSGKTNHDHSYFLRSCPNDFAADAPCRYETGYDTLLASIQGLERYKVFVQEQIRKLEKI